MGPPNPKPHPFHRLSRASITQCQSDSINSVPQARADFHHPHGFGGGSMGVPSLIHLHHWVTLLMSSLESLLAVPSLVSICRACPAFPGHKTNRAVEIFRKHLLQFSQQGCS